MRRRRIQICAADTLGYELELWEAGHQLSLKDAACEKPIIQWPKMLKKPLHPLSVHSLFP